MPRAWACTTVVAMNTTTTQSSVLAATLRGEGFTGRLAEPGDPDFDAARAGWNGAIDRRPAAVAFAGDAEDVAAAIRAARASALEFTIRAGGHSVAGRSVRDGALCIDLRGLDSIDVDPERGIVTAGGGTLLGELDAATQEHGLAVPAGQISHTGIGGLTLGGGVGWLMRHHGLTIDSLRAAEVVLADGRMVRASAGEHEDLFWALRGGGGDFGVVTSFEFGAHPVGPTVLAGMLVYPWAQAGDALRASRELMDGAPEELTVFVALITAPPEEPFPPELRGAPVAVVAVCWSGDLSEGERVLAPLRAGLPAGGRSRGADALRRAAVDAGRHRPPRLALPRPDALPARGRGRLRRRVAAAVRDGPHAAVPRDDGLDGRGGGPCPARAPPRSATAARTRSRGSSAARVTSRSSRRRTGSGAPGTRWRPTPPTACT